MAQTKRNIDAAIAAGLSPEEALAEQEDESFLDPFEFLGIQKPANVPAGPGMEVVPREVMDPREFLGISPGTVMVPTQSARATAAPASADWNLLKQFSSGLGFGTGPEMQGLENYLKAPSGSPLSFEQQVVNARGAKAAYEQENPYAKAVEIAGTVPSTILANELTPGLSAGLRSASPAVRVGSNIAAGMESGALQHRVVGGNDLVGDVLLGGTVQGTMPFIGKSVGGLLKPKVLPGAIETVREMEKLGVNLRPSQVAMNQALRRADELMASGGNEQQLKDYTRAVSRSFGENTDSLTGEVAGRAMNRINSTRDAIIAQTSVPLDAQLNSDLALVGAGLSGMDKESKAAIREGIRDIRKSFVNLKMDGPTYKRLTEGGGIISNLSMSKNQTVAAAGRRFRELLDDAVERGSPAGTKELWAENRAQMKNLLAVQPLLEGNVTGFVDPQKMHTQVKKFFSEYGWGKNIPGNMETLAEGGRFMPKIGPTGDPVKVERQNWYTRPGAVLPALGGLTFLGGALFESALLHQAPLAAVGLIASGGGAEIIRGARGSYMKSNFARNALTGAMGAPGILTSTGKPLAVGGANALKAQFEDEEEN